MVNFGLLAADIVSLVWGTPANFNGFRVLAALLHGTLVVGVSQTAAFNRGRHLYSAGRPSGSALAHISSLIYNTNRNLFLWIEIFISTMDLDNTTADRWSCHLPNRNVCATHVLPMGVGPYAFRYQGNGATPCLYIDTTRKAIDCATAKLMPLLQRAAMLALQVLY